MNSPRLRQRIVRFVKQKEVTTVAEIVAEFVPKGYLAREIRGTVVSLVVHEYLIRSRMCISLPPKGGISLVELGRRIDKAIKDLNFRPNPSARDHLQGYGRDDS